MMRRLSRTVLFSLLSTGLLPVVPAVYAQSAENQQPDVVSAESRELARRRMAVRDAMQEVQEARLAYTAKRYTKAEEHYRNALAVLPDAPATQRQRTFIKESLADALIARAIDYRAVGRHEEAAEFLQEAVQLDPKNRRAQAELSYTNDPVRTNPALSPQHVGNVAEVSRLLELADGAANLGRYDDALKSYQAVLKIDAYNSAARRGMEAVQQKRRSYMATARDAYRAKMMADVDAQWEESVPTEEPLLNDLDGGSSAVIQPEDEQRQSFVERLKKMVMPNIVFDGVHIDDVVDALRNQIARFEANDASANHHININTSFGAQDSPAYKRLHEQIINLNLSDVSIKDVLDILSDELDIRYFYTSYGVTLCLGGRDSGPLYDRVFSVPPHFFDPRSSQEEEDDDGFASSKVSVKRVSPQQMLKDMGITFPERAYAVYSPAARTLRVRNTAQNLEDIEAALNVPFSGTSQIVLSVVAMEVSENDLNQLGFEWLLNSSVGAKGTPILSGGHVQSAISTATGVPVISTELGTNNSPYVSSGLRGVGALKTSGGLESLIESGSAAASAVGTTAQSPTIFGVRGVWSVADVTFIMSGLSQKKGVDILQNPKIVLSPGVEEQVSVGSVDEMFFPQTWERGELQTSKGSIGNDQDFNVGYNSQVDNSGEDFDIQGDEITLTNIFKADSDPTSYYENSASGNRQRFTPVATGAIPVDFEKMGVTDEALDGFGTILTVHKAEIEEGAQGTFINIALTTTVKEFEGFINWGSPINSMLYTQTGRLEVMELTPNYILQPMIKRYVENTQLRVLPGTVIVMGGLKEAKCIQYEDKIPILGDLPLVGRLFRSSGESKQRKVLMFFVKVDYVDPTGKNPTTGERPSQEM